MTALNVFRLGPLQWLVLAAYGLSLPVMRLEPDLGILATVITLLLISLLYASRNSSESARWVVPSGVMASIAVVYIFWLLVPGGWMSTTPWVSWMCGWVVALMPIGYLVARLVLRDFQLARRFWGGVAMLVGLNAIWCLIRYILQADSRGMGTFLDSNAFGALMYCFLLPMMALYADAQSSPRIRRIAFGALILGFLALFSTQSRGAGAVLATTSLILYAGLRRAGWSINRASLHIAISALLCYLAIKISPSSVTRTLELAGDPSTLFRLMMWKSAWLAWLDYPVTGTGLGTYRLQYLHYRLPEETNTSGDLAHDDYLQILMEGGPVALLLLSTWGVFTLWTVWRLLQAGADRSLEDSRRRETTLALPLALGVLGLFAHALVNFIFYLAPLALSAGLLLGQAHRCLAGDHVRMVRLPVRRSLVTAMGLLGILLVSASLLIDFAASLALSPWMAHTPLSMSSASVERRYQAAEILSALRPYNFTAQQTLAGIATDQAIAHQNTAVGRHWAELAIENGKRFLEISYDNPAALQQLGRVVWGYPDLGARLAPMPTSAHGLFDRAINRYPAWADSYLLAAGELISRDQKDQAFAVLWSALKWREIPIPVGNVGLISSWQRLMVEGRALGEDRVRQHPTPDNLRMARDFGVTPSS